MFKIYKIGLFIFITILSCIIGLYLSDIIDLKLFIILFAILFLILLITEVFIVFSFKKESEKYKIELSEYSEKTKNLSHKVQSLNSEIDNLRKQLIISLDSLNSLQREYFNIASLTKEYFNYFNSNNILLEKYFNKSYFIISYPKSEIGEDILFIKKVNDYIVVVIVDASGVGVQLFLNNMIILNILENATSKEKISKPSEILKYINREIYENYNTEKFPYIITYSIGIISILYKYKIVEFAGARNSLLYSHNGAVIEQKGDPNLITNFSYNNNGFNNYGIPVNDNSILYLFTDGISNQTIKSKKLKRKYFIELINKYKYNSFNEQHTLIKKEIENLIMKQEQTDDIKILGIKIND